MQGYCNVGIALALYYIPLTNTELHTMTTTIAQATTLRTRIAAMAQAQAMMDIQATAQGTMLHSNVPSFTAHNHTATYSPKPASVTALQAIEYSAARAYDDARKDALQQAKNNLATANTVGQHNSLLGRALKRIAMCDMNSLRSLKGTIKQAAIISEYSNLGKFWE